ncbi:MAG: PspC domain-containing protein [Bacteroidales bacterium]|jgi:phage shock protein PspC (stress-responsive transcriptional regulator)|nr:PspC domain-containing protein [Bacteroidales bacterium]
MEKKLQRIKSKGVIGGVCAGFAEYFGIDVTIVRLIWVFLTFCGLAGLLIYIIALIVVPVGDK